MSRHWSVFQINPIYILIIALGTIGGCLPDDDFCYTGGKNCRVHFSGVKCHVSSEISCKNISKADGCGGYRYTAKPTKFCPDGNQCKLRCCPLCSSKTATVFDRQIAESNTPVTILNIDQTCDVITKGENPTVSYEECEIRANNRLCKGFDLIEFEEGEDLVDKCLLYECEACLLDYQYLDEGFLEQ